MESVTHANIFPSVSHMPLVGVGTWTQHVAGEVQDAVLTAIRCTWPCAVAGPNF
jgi:hypothetical protein